MHQLFFDVNGRVQKNLGEVKIVSGARLPGPADYIIKSNSHVNGVGGPAAGLPPVLGCVCDLICIMAC